MKLADLERGFEKIKKAQEKGIIGHNILVLPPNLIALLLKEMKPDRPNIESSKEKT